METIDKVEEAKKQFEGLTKKEQALKAYRMLLDKEKMPNVTNEEIIDTLFLLAKATNLNSGLLRPLILLAMYENEQDYKEVYKESLVNYKKILQNYKQLASELNINSSLDLSNMFSVLLWNGYFSPTKEHVYKMKDRKTLPEMYSFDVLRGKGVCLAYSDFLSDFLNECNKNAAVIQCKVPKTKKLQFNYRPEIERNIEIGFLEKLYSPLISFLAHPIINISGNHAITLIDDEEKGLYGYDSTNLSALKITGLNTAEIINGKGKFILKPNSSIVLSPNNDPKNLYEKLISTENHGEPFSRKEFIYSFEEIIELLQKNLFLLEAAYYNIHDELEQINKQTEKIGSKAKTIRKIKNEMKQQGQKKA